MTDVLEDTVDETEDVPALEEQGAVGEISEDAAAAAPESIELPHGNLLEADPETEIAAAGDEVGEVEAEPQHDPEQPPPYVPPTEEVWAAMRESERQNAARATAFQHRMSEMSGERRLLRETLDAIQDRLKPIEKHTSTQQAAAQRLQDVAALPAEGTPERFQHDLKKNLLDELTPLITNLEEKIKPVAEMVSHNQQQQMHQDQVHNQSAQLRSRADFEDSSLDPATWAAVQDWECRQANYFETRGMDAKSARSAAVTKRYQLYVQHWSAQHAGMAGADVSAPVALVEEDRAWHPPQNGTASPVPATTAAVSHHRQLQDENPVPTVGGGVPASAGSPVKAIAKRIKNGHLEAEALADELDVALSAMQKKHPNLTSERLDYMILQEMEAT